MFAGTASIKLPEPPKPVKGQIGLGAFAPVFTPVLFTFEANFKQDIGIAIGSALEKEAEIIDEIGAAMVQDLNLALESALKAPVWSWNGGARDIYDTGELASSGGAIWTSSGIQISYDAPYASIVHDGGYIHPYGNLNARPVFLPARPWIRATLEGGGPVPQFDVASYFKKS